MQEPCSASDIAKTILIRTGDAMSEGDFDAFAECFSLPLVMETFEGRLLLQTRNDIRRTFEAVRRFRIESGVVRNIRENISAEFVDSNTIATTHVSRMLLAHDVLFGQPYVAYSLIRRISGRWLISLCQYAVDDMPQLNAALASHKEKDAAQGRRPELAEFGGQARSPDLRTSS